MGFLDAGSLASADPRFDLRAPNFLSGDSGPIDPRKVFTAGDIAGRRGKRKNRIKYGEFRDLKPGQELQLRGANEFQASRRRGRQATESLMGEANQVGLSQALAEARGQAGRTFASEVGSLQRRQGGLGLQLSERQQRAQRRRIGLGRAVSEASATNATRRTFAGNAEAAQRAGVGLENELFGAENASLVQLSNAAGQNQIQADQMRADREGDRAETIGKVVGTVAMMFSSEDFKHDKKPARGLLEKLKKVRVENWKYRGDDHTNHIGPYAEEFNDTFGVGQDDKQKIAIIDMLGVTLGAVKELSERVDG
jgi:hypothetical protein